MGGTGLKADVLDKDGTPVADAGPGAHQVPHAARTSWSPTLTKLVAKLPEGDRVSCGFPGMVRSGHVLSAPHFVLEKGPGSKTDPKLQAAWSDFDLAVRPRRSPSASRAASPTTPTCRAWPSCGARASRSVITLGTGFGTAFFMDGNLMPHMEFSHLEFRKGETFNEQIGEAARKKVGDERWNKRVRKAIAYLDALCFFDHLYIGGGNGPRVNRRDLGDVLERITVVDNKAGILGGIKLWDAHHIGVEGRTAMTAVDTEPLAWDPLNEKYKADPHAIWKRLRDEQPLYYNEQYDFYAVSRFAEVDAFSRDPKTFISSHGTVMEMITADPIDMQMMIFMDPPEHTRYRRLVSKTFTPRRMKLLEDDIRALCVNLLDGLVGRSSFDYVQDFGARVPAYVIAALLGVPPEDRDMVRGWIDESFHLDPETGHVERHLDGGHVQRSWSTSARR